MCEMTKTNVRLSVISR